jgi:hypothetical protein
MFVLHFLLRLLLSLQSRLRYGWFTSICGTDVDGSHYSLAEDGSGQVRGPVATLQSYGEEATPAYKAPVAVHPAATMPTAMASVEVTVEGGSSLLATADAAPPSSSPTGAARAPAVEEEEDELTNVSADDPLMEVSL